MLAQLLGAVANNFFLLIPAVISKAFKLPVDLSINLLLYIFNLLIVQRNNKWIRRKLT